MGLKREFIEFIESCANQTIGELNGKKMLEFGDQIITDESIPEKTGKLYFSNIGVEHVSVDLSGQHGALKLDLSKPQQFSRWRGYFDIVTNAGTSEHVEPTSAQYECFLVIHNALKVGGVAVHLVPDINELESKGCWSGHCNNYYSHEFFVMLAKNNNYRLVASTVMDGLRCSAIQKQVDAPFMEGRATFLEHIAVRKGGIMYPGANVSWSIFLLKRTAHYLKRPFTIPRMVSGKVKRMVGKVFGKGQSSE